LAPTYFPFRNHSNSTVYQRSNHQPQSLLCSSDNSNSSRIRRSLSWFIAIKMLRRPATQLSLTQADIDQFETNRQRKEWEQQQAQKQDPATSADASDKSKEQSQPNVAKSKKDRIMGGSGHGN
jgi:hypothetical protein